MSIRHHLGYWTVFIGEQAVLSCASFERAVFWMEELQV
jgi:hypothetical protein